MRSRAVLGFVALGDVGMGFRFLARVTCFEKSNIDARIKAR
jgi:hypothetical protein